MIHHLLQQLINRTKIILDGTHIRRTSKIIHKDISHSMHKFNDQERRDFSRTGREVGQTISQNTKEINRTPIPIPATAMLAIHRDLHDGRVRIVEGQRVEAGSSACGGHTAVMIQRYACAFPKMIADGSWGHAAEMTLD